jgi:hypothetical protein
MEIPEDRLVMISALAALGFLVAVSATSQRNGYPEKDCEAGLGPSYDCPLALIDMDKAGFVRPILVVPPPANLAGSCP